MSDQKSDSLLNAFVLSSSLFVITRCLVVKDDCTLQLEARDSNLPRNNKKTHIPMESETVKPPKALINMSRKVMPALVVATKLSQGEKDLEDPYVVIFPHSG